MGMQCYDIGGDEIMAKLKQFFKQYFIYICLVAACLSLLTYLIAFSCELSRILDARRTNNDVVSIMLSTIYFVLFLSATILINGLATRLAVGLLIWAVIFSILTIPELWLIMVQFWGTESNHGLTEVICYFIRLILNCVILIHVVPLALKWRKEKKILKQLESLASRLQLTSSPQQAQGNFIGNYNGTIQRTTTKDVVDSDSSIQGSNMNEKSVGGLDNNGYLQSYYGSQSEFDASIFGLNPSHYIGPSLPNNPMAKRTQSLLDLRFTTMTTKTMTKSNNKDKSDSMSLNSYDMRLQNNLSKNVRLKRSRDRIDNNTAETPLSKKKSLGRNCVSLENIGVFITEDGFSGNFPGCPPVYPAYFYYNHPYQQQMMAPFPPNNYFAHQTSAYFNNSSSIVSGANPSVDDFRKYRDVAL